MTSLRTYVLTLGMGDRRHAVGNFRIRLGHVPSVRSNSCIVPESCGPMPGKIVGLVTAAVLPPAVIAGLWRDLVTSHPLIAAVLLLVYEGVLGLAAFVWGIAQEVAKRWQHRLVERVDQALWQRLSRFPRRYRAALLGSLRFVYLKDLKTPGYYAPELDEIYIDLRLARQLPERVEQSFLARFPQDATARLGLDEFLDSDHPVILAIVGAPGSGKTTLVRRTARQICQAPRGRRRPVPILLFLRDHVTTVLASAQVTLADLVRTTLERGVDEPTGWFEQRLRDGECVVLLDGLDEVAKEEERLVMAAWVERQVAQYPANDFVVTSRPQGYIAAPVDGAAVLQVRSLTDDQVTKFVHSWYFAVLRHFPDREESDVRREAQSAADDLLARLNNAPSLLDLTVNPLLLTMIANVHFYRGALPGSRAQLYDEICQVILWRRQEFKRIGSELRGEQKEILLRRLAFSMMDQRVRDLPRSLVLAEIEPMLRRMPTSQTAAEFLAEAGSSGLLVERESGQYSFAHQTFQEYLAAAHLHDVGGSGLLAGTVDDVWWRESTLLYVIGSDADAVVEACLSSGSVTALSLAFDCAEQGCHLAPELRERLDGLLASALGPGTDRDRLRLMASVMATRQLRQLVRTQAGGHICTRPVTRGLYRLFRLDCDVPPPDRPGVDGATGATPADRRDAEPPVTGVRAAEAVAFVGWVNGITSDDPGYRLPTQRELQDPAVLRALTFVRHGAGSRSFWLMPDREPERPQLWPVPGSPHPYAMDAVTLKRHVSEDMRRARTALVRLLLVRGVVSLRVLSHTLDLAPTHGVAAADALDHTHDLVRTLRHTVALDPGLRGQLTAAFALAEDLGGTLRRARRRDRSGGIAAALEHRLVSALEVRRDGAQADVLDLVLPPGMAVGGELSNDHVFDRALEHAMGTALSSSMTHVLRLDADADSWFTEFAREFIEETCAEFGPRTVPLSDLPAMAREAGSLLLSCLQGSSEVVPGTWARTVVPLFVEAMTSAWGSRDGIAPYAASRVRLAALCLAAEAAARGASRARHIFLDLAAGVTLLEERHTGVRTPDEMILLGTS
ncbi:NACHT domain-containing protein [Streptomyces sp. NPDC048291]|uniref:NACHT domain-containing protein n=1 Tax=Streptomyces sp. NPDC048291 TaxID=3365530 RepID=UPI00370F8F4F